MVTNRKSYNLAIGFVIVAIVCILIAMIGYFILRPGKPVIQGEVESDDYRISGKITGRIDSIAVQVGEEVHRGDTLVFLSAPEINAKEAQAKAAEFAAASQKQKALKGERNEEIRIAFQTFQQASVQEKVMKKSFDRIQALFDEKVISAQEYDMAKVRSDAAEAQAKAAESQYEMALEGSRAEDKAYASAQLEQAAGLSNEINSCARDLCLTSPCNGYVSRIYPKVGELVTTGNQIMGISDIDNVWFTFNIREDDMHSLKTGDKIKVTIPYLGKKNVSATVSMIKLRDTYATWKATTDTKGYDMKTFEVRAVLDSTIEGIMTGMSVTLDNRVNSLPKNTR